MTRVSHIPWRNAAEWSRTFPYSPAAHLCSSGRSRAGSDSESTYSAITKSSARSFSVTHLLMANRASIFDATPRYWLTDHTGQSSNCSKRAMLSSIS